jgi:cation diffusion facilitator CzcD-associated flavoprotein CzcO
MITSPILRIAPTGIVTSNPDGSETLHEGDVLILGTGFKTHDFLGTLEVIDADGKKLGDRWNGLGGAEAYYGIMVSGLPNLFMCYGPSMSLYLDLSRDFF